MAGSKVRKYTIEREDPNSCILSSYDARTGDFHAFCIIPSGIERKAFTEKELQILWRMVRMLNEAEERV